jgi:hypothetical protein
MREYSLYQAPYLKWMSFAMSKRRVTDGSSLDTAEMGVDIGVLFV